MSAGVDLSGMELNIWQIPGVLNYDYVQPSMSELEYYHGKGLNLVRLPIAWERLEPNLLAVHRSTAFNTAYVAQIEQVLSEAHAQSMSVIIDLHDYGGYANDKIGDGTLMPSMFSAMWQHLARLLATQPGLGGYDLMNEPNGMPSASVWPGAAQGAVNAIRRVDQTTPIYVEGDFWASAASWTTYNDKLAIKDSASNLIYQAHVYGDSDDSGTGFDWATEAAQGVTVQTIAQRVSVFTGWCQANARRCMIGEVGVGNDDPNWNTELANGLAAMQSGGMLSFTYWAGGPWWGTYPMSLEPTSAGDAPQMAVVAPYGH